MLLTWCFLFLCKVVFLVATVFAVAGLAVALDVSGSAVGASAIYVAEFFAKLFCVFAKTAHSCSFHCGPCSL